jgi:methionine synthase II (cobalamin-independent)
VSFSVESARFPWSPLLTAHSTCRWYHLRHGEHAVDKTVYPTDDLYFADLAKAYREELADLYDAGCRNVQFDDPLLGAW